MEHIHTTGSLSPTCAVNSISLKSNKTGTSVRSIRVVAVSIQATTVISITLIDIWGLNVYMLPILKLNSTSLTLQLKPSGMRE